MTEVKLMRVWWIPQIPMEPFYVSVKSPIDGARIIDILAKYDLFQFNHKVKPDYCNQGGLEVLENGAWIEWENEHGDISDFLYYLSENES